MPDDDLLRLVALDSEDLTILSAHVQDSVVKVKDIVLEGGDLVLAMNRFVWEKSAVSTWRKREYMRRRSALRVARVNRLQSTGIDRGAPDTVLELLAIEFEPAEAPSGDILIAFAGGATLRASVEVPEVQLTDLGPAWSTERAPRHRLG
jgi:hypothetical protein